MAIAQQTEQLFARVFGRSSESPEERNFLKDLEARKGVGTSSSQGALEFAKQQGSFGGFSQTGQQSGQAPADPGSIDAMSSGMDLLKKKMVDLDKAQKKLFREESKFDIKKLLLSDPGVKEMLATQAGLTNTLSTKNFEEDIPVTPGITNPLDVGRAALGQQEGIGSFVKSAVELINQGKESITNILDRLGTQRQADVDNIRASLSDVIALNQESRAGQKHEIEMQQALKSLKGSAKGMTAQQRLALLIDTSAQLGLTLDPGVVNGLLTEVGLGGGFMEFNTQPGAQPVITEIIPSTAADPTSGLRIEGGNSGLAPAGGALPAFTIQGGSGGSAGSSDLIQQAQKYISQ